MLILILEKDEKKASEVATKLQTVSLYQTRTITDTNNLRKELNDRPSAAFISTNFANEETIKLIKEYDCAVAVVYTDNADATIQNIAQLGADDYVQYNDAARMIHICRQAEKNINLLTQLYALKQDLKAHYFKFSELIIGSNESLAGIFTIIERAAAHDIPVTILGESGTGKESVAKAIHYASNRKLAPFITVDAASLAADDIDDELFGHEKRGTKGKIEQAQNGTLFLNEIESLDKTGQVKLLRVIQERKVTRMEGTTSIPINVRIIASAKNNLSEEVRKGNFREDLYYGLLGLTIQLPPLRVRGTDIILLAQTYLDAYCEANKKGKKNLSEGAKKKLLSYHFPGNIRELRAMLELAVVLANGNEVTEQDIVIQEHNQNTHLLTSEFTLEEYTRRIVEYFLDKYDYKVAIVAEKLGIGRSTIYRMMREFRLDIDDDDE